MFLDAEEKVYDRPFMLIEDGVLKKYIADEDGIVTIPECVETIASGVFSWEGMPEDQFDYWESENEQMLDRIHIPATVKAIEPGAFLGTFYLQDFSIDPNCPAAELIDGILYSRDKKRVIFATKGMRDIPEIKLPSTVKVIDDYAFMGRFFDKLVLPDSVERIGVGAFAYGGFDSVTIPDSVKEIGEDAFVGCRFDYDSIQIGENSTVLKKDEFGLYAENGELLLAVFYTAEECIDVPAGVKAISGTAFGGLRPHEVTIPEGVLVLRDSLFFWHSRLEKVVLPDSLIGIGTDVFTGCENLTEIRMSTNLEEIHPYAFNGCNKLETLHLPATVKSIGKNAFMSCDKLTIHAPQGSYAITYAKENGIAYKEV